MKRVSKFPVLELALLGLVASLGSACDDSDVMQLAPKIELEQCEAPGFVENCALDFGEVPISLSRPLDIVVHNPSGVGLEISKFELSADSDPAFHIADDWSPVTVAAGGEAGLGITFVPQVESSVQGKVYIYHDGDNTPSPIEVLLTGSGKDLGQPDIRVDPPACAFGDVGIGATAFCDLSISNAGQLDLVIENVSGDGDFDPTDSNSIFQPASVFIVPVYLPSQAGATVRIACTPTTTTTYTGTLYLDSNDPDSQRTAVALSCTGAEVPTAVARVKSINGDLVSGDASQVSPLDNVVLTGADSTPGTPGRTISEYAWEIVSKPSDSTVTLKTPSQVETAFEFNSSGMMRPGLDVAGTFVVKLTVTDSDGFASTNDARVTLNSVPGEDIHLQLTWDHSTADIDVHFIRRNGDPWSGDDCYYGNCKGATGLDWGGGSSNPHLDVDDTDGFGPENINLAAPSTGTYRVAVHYYSTGSSLSAAVAVNVKIFIRGGLRAEYTRQLTTCNQYWDVADIEWPSSLVNPVDSVRMDSHGSCF